MPAPRNKSLFFTNKYKQSIPGSFYFAEKRTKKWNGSFSKMRREGGNRAEEEVETSQIVQVSVRRVPSCRTGSRFVFLGRKSNSEEGQNRKFEKFTERVFCEELESNTVSLHVYAA